MTDATALQPVKTAQPKEKKSPFVKLPNGHLSGTLLDGVQVGADKLIEFEMRPCLASDMFDAEKDVSADRSIAYRGALIGRMLVRLGNLAGPIDFAVIGKLTPRDLMLLVSALDEVEEATKSEPLEN